jgi:signal transduction histidine kinase
MMDALERWGNAPRCWELGELAEASIPADRDRLAAALDALLENAIAHTEKGDRIELSARIQHGQAIFTVADSGCGIPEADLDRIFARFARSTPPRSRQSGGFGLGLPIARAIAEAHHGTVQVRSSPGHGSTFELLIPAAPPALDGPGPRGPGPGRPRASEES